MDKKRNYEFTGECMINEAGVTLRRIRRIRILGGTEIWETGGWIEKEENLSDGAWVGDNAEVFGDAEVCGNVLICENMRVCGNVRIGGNAVISGDAEICGKGDEKDETAAKTDNSRPTDYDMELRRFCVEKAVQLSNAGRGDVSLLAMDIERYIRHGKCKFL